MSISTRKTRQLAFGSRFNLALLGSILTLAGVGCNESDGDATNNAQIKSFESFEASTRRLEGGVYVVNGDEVLENREELKKYYDEVVSVQAKAKKSDVAVAEQPLVVDRRFNSDNVWNLTERSNLTYCIETGGFTSTELTKVVNALNTATSDWESAVYNRVNFIYKTSENSRCSSANNAVVFNVKKEDLNPGYKSGAIIAAISFFPHYTRSNSQLRIDPRLLTATSSEIVGVMRHELGHVLGFRHEFVNPRSSCDEGAYGARLLTSFDQNSIMNYDSCDNKQSRINLTETDKIGARSVYTDNAINPLQAGIQAYPSGWDFGTPSPYTRVEGDFDGNGTTDYIRMSGTHYFVFLSSNGTFTPSIQAFPTGYDFGTPSQYSTLKGDFNGDGYGDFIRIGANDFHVFYSLGNGTFSVQSTVIPYGWNFGWGGSKDFAEDINDDGVTDVIRLFSNHEFRFTFNKSGAFDSTAVALPASWPQFGAPSNYEVISIDPLTNYNQPGGYVILGADQYYMVYFHYDASNVLQRGTWQAAYAAGWIFGMPSSFTTITGDFDGDRDTDFVRLAGDAYYMFLNNGDATFTPSAVAYGNGWDFGIPSSFTTVAGDFNGDDRTDFCRMSGTHAFTFFSNGNGTFNSFAEGFPAGWDFGTPSLFETFVGDFNGDGKDEIERIFGTAQFSLYR